MSYLKTISPATGNPLVYYVTEATIATINKHRDVEEALRRYGQCVAVGWKQRDGGIQWCHPRNGTVVTEIWHEVDTAPRAVDVLGSHPRK